MAGVSPCVITNIIANDYVNVVTALNRKYNALLRLVELLEQLADITSFLPPNLSSLVPLYLINFDTYTNLVTACPFLNLPPTPSNASTAELQGIVNQAYARFIQMLKKNPLYKLGRLQSQLESLNQQANEILNTGNQYLQCFQQACASAAEVGDFAGHIVETDFNGQIDDYTRTYLANNGQVLNTATQNKVNELNGTIDSINELRTTAPVVTPSPVTPISSIPPVAPVPQIPSPPPNA